MSHTRHLLHLNYFMWATLLTLSASVAAVEKGDPATEPLDCVINPSVVADLGSGVPGILSKVQVDRSDFVNVGDVVAEMESSVESAALDLARARAALTAEVDLRRVNAAFGQRQNKRTKDLFTRKAISTNDMDQRETESRLAHIQLRQALDNQELAQLEMLRAKEILKRRTIKSPIDGVVMDRFKVIGEYVEDQPVVRVAQIDPLHVEVIVPVERLGMIRKGMYAEVWSDNVEGESWQATVSRVDRVADVASGTYGVRLTMPNPDYKIPAGLRCRMQLVEKPAAPVEEQSAEVFDPGSKKTVADASDGAAIASPLVIEEPVKQTSARQSPATSVPGKEETKDVKPMDALPECRLAGPYNDQVQAARKVVTLRRAGLHVDIKSVPASRTPGYMILSPVLANRAEAKALAARLEEAGVTDYYVPRKRNGPLRVSLGFYSSKKMAQRTISGLANKGFNAELLPRKEKGSKHFLIIRGVPSAANGKLVASLPVPDGGHGSTHRFCNHLAGR